MLKTLLYSFFTVFLAELGDKTQLTTMLISSQSTSKLSVFIGSALALTLNSLIGVLLGSMLYKWISPHTLRLSAGLAFMIIGFYLIIHTVD